jgi:SAM-dependent methyltransferase
MRILAQNPPACCYPPKLHEQRFMVSATAVLQYCLGLPMDRQTLAAVWLQEEQESFAGWDFSHLAGRLREEQPPWSYAEYAGQLMRQASSVLDLGTGGGERLLGLREHWPPRVAATEGYPPNLALATERLSPLGVKVKGAESDESTILPFADAAYDLVISRHSSFNAAEVARVLTPGGTFFTQQVHGRSGEDLQALFGATPQWPYATPDYFAAQLAAAGLSISKQREWVGKMTFTDVGAIVYYLKAVPWSVPGFTVASYLDALLGLQEQLATGRELAFITRLYILEARKPAGDWPQHIAGIPSPAITPATTD